ARIEAAPDAEGAILHNGARWAESGFLVAAGHVEDCIVRLEFMIPEGAESGVYVHGRYEIQIADSRGETALSSTTLGGISGRRATPGAPGPEHPGSPPLANAAKPAGEWQTLEASFRAPRFDEAGFKTEDACFLEVKINGVLVQEMAVAPTYSAGARFGWEQTDGAVAIDGADGPVAIRAFEV